MQYFLLAMFSINFLVASASEWTTCFENEQVKILYQYSDCHDNKNGIHQQKVLLSFINKTGNRIQVSYSRDLTYKGTENSLGGDIKPFVVILNPEEEKQAACSDKDRALFIFSKHLNITGNELKNFKLTNVSVKTIY